VSVLSGAMISMGKLLEKLGPKRYSPECVEGESSEVERVGERRIFVGVSRCIYNVPKGFIGKDRSDVGGDGRRVGPHTGAA
jgi:hypothetical protein